MSRPPYPVELVPLLPRFLSGKRLPADWMQRAAEEHGIDRPAVLIALQVERGGERGIEERRLSSVYSTRPGSVTPALGAAESAGLIARGGRGWQATEQGRELASRLRHASFAHLGSLDAGPEPEVRAVAALLERAFQACAAAPEPATKRRTELGKGFRGGLTAPNALAALDQAVYGLWMFRDDCHIAAWQAAGLEGPALDVLTRIWRDRPASLEELVPQLVQQGPADVAAAVDRLRADGLVAPDRLEVTARGASLREGIESETDRLFFTPWPDEAAAGAARLKEGLERAIAAVS